jgi:hypothetical protein
MLNALLTTYPSTNMALEPAKLLGGDGRGGTKSRDCAAVDYGHHNNNNNNHKRLMINYDGDVDVIHAHE